MKSILIIFTIFIMVISINSCAPKENKSEIKIVFLHHSTGYCIWNGNTNTKLSKISGRISGRLSNYLRAKAELPTLFEKYNKAYSKNYSIREISFPKALPYGWNNYPYDYYNIWVKNAGEYTFMEEPTLELLTKEFNVVIFKHCFPVSNIQSDTDSSDINSDLKTISNYKLQYSALRDKLHQFAGTKFILFTGAAQVKPNITEDEANRAKEFFNWVIEEWDLQADNIYLWDLYSLQTEGNLYFKDEYALSVNDSHPNEVFAGKIVKLLFSRIIDIVENNGKSTSLTGTAK